MLAVEAAEQVVEINTTLWTIAGGLGGVVITVGATLIGAWLQSRREHRRWLIEKRAEAFQSALEAINRRELWRNDVIDCHAQKRALEDRGSDASQSMSVDELDAQIAKVDRELADLTERWPQIVDQWADAISGLTLYATRDVLDHTTNHGRAFSNESADDDEFVDLRTNLQVAMRKAMKIPG